MILDHDSSEWLCWNLVNLYLSINYVFNLFLFTLGMYSKFCRKSEGPKKFIEGKSKFFFDKIIKEIGTEVGIPPRPCFPTHYLPLLLSTLHNKCIISRNNAFSLKCEKTAISYIETKKRIYTINFIQIGIKGSGNPIKNANSMYNTIIIALFLPAAFKRARWNISFCCYGQSHVLYGGLRTFGESR